MYRPELPPPSKRQWGGFCSWASLVLRTAGCWPGLLADRARALRSVDLTHVRPASRILYCSTSIENLAQPADFSADQTEIQCQFRSASSMQPAGGLPVSG
eukprot:COSAG01_NODE_9120_length_2545_cov_2.658217_2_plen_100_part_00